MIYRFGYDLGYLLFYLFAWEPKLPGTLGIGIKDGFDKAWLEYEFREL